MYFNLLKRKIFKLRCYIKIFSDKMEDNKNSNLVQVSITNISFPVTLKDFLNLIEKNREYPIEFKTDLDVLLNFDHIRKINPDFVLEWSSQKNLREGDILFFYHAATAKPKVRKVLKIAKKNYPEDHEIIKTLEHADNLADHYAGKILGCTKISGPAKYHNDNYEYHFSNRIFAPFNKVFLFNKPLDKKEFSKYICIARGGTNTPIHTKESFEGIKKLLAENNELPDILKSVTLR